MKAYVVGISGGTCSGKTTLATKLYETLSEKYKTSVMHMDDYFRWDLMKTIAPFTGIEYVEHNHPDIVDMDKFYVDFYDIANSAEIVIVEGVFALYFAQLREKLDLKIFVDLKSDERLYRRIKRHMAKDQTLDEVAVRYLDTVRHRHDEFVEPTRWYADIVVNGNLDANMETGVIISHINMSTFKETNREEHTSWNNLNV